MKRIFFPLIAVVLLLSINRTTAQSLQVADGKKNQTATLTRHANPDVAVTPASAKSLPHKSQMTPAEIEQHEANLVSQLQQVYTNNLSLTAEQQNKVHAACLKYAQAMDEQRTGTRVTPEMSGKYSAELNSNIQSVLTPEQNQTLQASKSVKGSATSRNESTH